MDTIVALSTAPGKAALAVVRASGPLVRFIAETMLSRPLPARVATVVKVRDPETLQVLDEAVAVLFTAPASATGEDVLELSLHGSAAVVRAVLAALQRSGPYVRLARPGEFTRRALENGKLDLLQVEALGDLLDADTESQRLQAARLLEGHFGETVRGFRDDLMQARALLEAEIDFSDEGDVSGPLQEQAATRAAHVADVIRGWLKGAGAGRRIRDGLRVALVGAPNAGKSSLINALAARDVAIVSPVPGTTRDRIEAFVELDGHAVVLTDTAGMRETDDPVEHDGVLRARMTMAEADLVLSLRAPGQEHVAVERERARVIHIATMVDKPDQHVRTGEMPLSTSTGIGLSDLVQTIVTQMRDLSSVEAPVITRARQEEVLTRAYDALMRARADKLPLELVAEELRAATAALGELVGEVGVELVLDRLFAGFCIGK